MVATEISIKKLLVSSQKRKEKKETVTIAFVPNKLALHNHEIVQVYNNCFSLFNHAVH